MPFLEEISVGPFRIVDSASLTEEQFREVRKQTQGHFKELMTTSSINYVCDEPTDIRSEAIAKGRLEYIEQLKRGEITEREVYALMQPAIDAAIAEKFPVFDRQLVIYEGIAIRGVFMLSRIELVRVVESMSDYEAMPVPGLLGSGSADWVSLYADLLHGLLETPTRLRVGAERSSDDVTTQLVAWKAPQTFVGNSDFIQSLTEVTIQLRQRGCIVTEYLDVEGYSRIERITL